MSARRRNLTISTDAEQDIEEILLYTEGAWGSEQAITYKRRLFEALDELVVYPELGPARNDLFSGCRVLRIDMHKAFYWVNPTEILVVRILHERQDTTKLARESES